MRRASRPRVPVATGTSCDGHHALGHAELALDLYAHVHLLVVVIGGPLLHGITQGVLALPLDPFMATSVDSMIMVLLVVIWLG